jgi:hypothetical protein
VLALAPEMITFVDGTLAVNKGTAVVTVSSPSESTYGQPVTFTAAVSAGATGTVDFLDGTTVRCGVSELRQHARDFTAAGHTSYYSGYAGGANNGATSAVFLQVANRATPGSGGVAAVSGLFAEPVSTGPVGDLYVDGASEVVFHIVGCACGTIRVHRSLSRKIHRASGSPFH